MLSRVGQGNRQLSNFRRTLFYIPFVGLIVTLLISGIFSAGHLLIADAFIVVLILTAVQYLLFNLFHFDGLLDTFDAFTPQASPERRLQILKDVHVGAFGLFFGALYIAAKLYLLARGTVYLYIVESAPLYKTVMILIFFSYPLSGRGACVLIPIVTGPAKNEGLGASLKECRRGSGAAGTAVVLGLFCALPVLAFILGYGPSLLFLISFTAIPAAGIFTGYLYRRKTGGYTGDAFGCAVELGELLHLFIVYLLFLFGTLG
jgi:adenosylcobinamide-GDP ribazoletransferase